MVRPYQESLAEKVRPELAQRPYQTEHFSPSRAIPTLSLGQRTTRVRHDYFGFLFSLAQHRPKAGSAGVHLDYDLPMEFRIGEDGRRFGPFFQQPGKQTGDSRIADDELAYPRPQSPCFNVSDFDNTEDASVMLKIGERTPQIAEPFTTTVKKYQYSP
ncbi:conserved hypothetical protein [Trichinella spiralis]|uniref:hypothetical protein n=1 Tax=Trichinella spiralis TaxID=6334 RepID=UPI0001EFEE04|nr:conserved hypothetical protein [Trichinella spiralis]